MVEHWDVLQPVPESVAKDHPMYRGNERRDRATALVCGARSRLEHRTAGERPSCPVVILIIPAGSGAQAKRQAAPQQRLGNATYRPKYSAP